jgi:hypothetical protein
LKESIMNMVFKRLGMAAMLLFSMMSAFAKHDNSSTERAATHLEHQQLAQVSQGRPNEAQGQGPRREERESGALGEDRSRQPGGFFGQPREEGQRSGRMTPEERRELRRQINEAGRNIYAPAR